MAKQKWPRLVEPAIVEFEGQLRATKANLDDLSPRGFGESQRPPSSFLRNLRALESRASVVRQMLGLPPVARS